MRTLSLLVCLVWGIHPTILPNHAPAQELPGEKLTLLITGDTFGYVDTTPVGDQIAGGIVRRKTVIEQTRHTVGSDNLLLLDGGNALGYYYLLRADRGATMIRAMQTVGYDAMTVGNHDLSYGEELLRSYANSPLGLNIVCANLTLKSTNEPLLNPYVILRKGENIRVAVFGLAHPEVERSVLRQHIEGLGIADPIHTAHQILPRLRREADLVIALTQLPLDECFALATQVPGIDIIVARARSEAATSTVRTESIVRPDQTLIVAPVRYGSGVSRIELSFDRRAGIARAALSEIIPVDASVASDFVFATQLAIAGEQQYYEYCRSRFGVDPDEPLLLVDASFTIRDLPRLVLHLLLQHTGTEIALLNANFFRFEGIELPLYEENPAFRKITIRTLERILWTDNELVTMRLTGQQLAAIRLTSTAAKNTKRGSFLEHLQVTEDGAEEWYIHNSPIQLRTPPEYYSVVTSNYLAGGAEGYTTFREGSALYAGARPPRADSAHRPVIIRDLLISHLIRARDVNRSLHVSLAAVTDSSYLARSLWRFSLSRLHLGYSAGQYRSNEDYRAIGLTELRGIDFERITYDADLRLRLESRSLIWDHRLFATFGQSRIKDQPLQEVTDDLFFETVISLRSPRATRSLTIYPSASARYDTEFTPTESKQTIAGSTVTTTNPRQQDITIGLGVSFSDFAGFSRTRLSLTQTFDRSTKPRPDENGINLQTIYQLPLAGSVFRSELDGTYYIKQKRSSGDTRRLLVRWRSDLNIPLGRLTLAPSLNIFLFQGQSSSKPGVSPPLATAVVLGITLGYSFDWKMQYESLF